MRKADRLLLVALAVTAGVMWLYSLRQQRSKDTGNTLLTNLIGQFMTLTGNTQHTSQSGKDAIRRREGVKYTVYLDAIGIPTGGVGHVILAKDGNYSEGDSIDPAQVEAWFADDVVIAENIVKRYVSVPLSQYQFDALVSVVFNTGSRFFRNANGTQTRVSAYLDAGDYASAAAQFDRWVYGANGVKLAGLVSRRGGEKSQFMGMVA